MRAALVMIVAASLYAPFTLAQQRTLSELQALAIDSDPRMRQLAIEEEQTGLRLRNLDAERRPVLSVEANAQYQTDVVSFPIALPGGASPPTAAKDTYDAYVRLEHTLLDPTASARREDERAKLAEARARITAALFPLREEVNEAFFAAALAEEREAQVRTAITDLEVRLAETRERVAAGTALPGAAASIEAMLLSRRQDLLDLQAKSAASRARLSSMTGRPLGRDERLVLPDLTVAGEHAREVVSTSRTRPEYKHFARIRERLEARRRLVDAQEKPRVVAFGRVGYGKPGLNFLSDSFDAYAVGGVRVQWTPVRWGTPERERRLIELQQEAVRADEDAFTRSIERRAQNDLPLIDERVQILAIDDRIVELRELVHRETLARYREQVVTTAEYIDAETDVLEARLVRAAHRVELAHARARLVTLLGLEVH